MNILILQFTHISLSLNGAEQYHHNLAKELIARGHAVIPVCHNLQSETLFDGVLALPYSEMPRLYNEWADLIITTPGKMRNNPKNKPVVYIQHNENREVWDLSQGRVLYCAEHVRRKVGYTCKDDYVFWPFNRYAGCEPLQPAYNGDIALVNCNRNKGGWLLPYFAKKMPQYNFLGVHAGYGHQHREDGIFNLGYEDGGFQLRRLLSTCSLLIMPSEKEGMPTIALEAMSLGVPVVGSAIDAFLELGIRPNKKVTRDYMIKDIEWAMNNYLELREKQLTLVNQIEANRNTDGLIEWLTNI